MSGLFWFVEGILFCVALLGLRAWTQDRGVPMPLWKWILVVGWLGLLGFSLAFIGTSLGEGETIAAVKGGALFILITVIVGVGFWRVLGFSNRVDGRDERDERAELASDDRSGPVDEEV